MSNSGQRDSAQAMHLHELIRKDPSAKVLVLVGYGHIEKMKSDGDFIPMAYQFKSLSGINPFCIDQTSMTEEGNSGFSSLFYNLLLTAYLAKQPSVLMKDNQPLDLLEDTTRYDVKIIHPRAVYFAGRATWYSLENERKPFMVSKHPENTFLVQAYYLNEWVKNPPSEIIPADQTYIKTQKKSYALFLKRGRYKIMYRDMGYKILGIKDICIQ